MALASRGRRMLRRFGVRVCAASRRRRARRRRCGGRDSPRPIPRSSRTRPPAPTNSPTARGCCGGSSASLAPSYLFGTIHSTDDGAADRAPRRAVAAKATIVATELGGPFDASRPGALAAKLLAAAIDRDEDTFAGPIAPAPRARRGVLAAQGLPKELAHHLKLWFLANCRRAACEQARERRPARGRRDRRRGGADGAEIPVVGLETADEQLSPRRCARRWPRRC